MADNNPEYYHQQALTNIALNNQDVAEKFYKKAIQISNRNELYFFDYEIISELPDRFIQSIRYISNNIENYKDIQNELIADIFIPCVCLRKILKENALDTDQISKKLFAILICLQIYLIIRQMLLT
ncbi:hypothetical protein pb186bvf_000239 [Paramecium bursaria]